jgi:hypothetical protein
MLQQPTIRSTLHVDMLVGGLVCALVGVPFRQRVGVLVGDLVGVLSSNLDYKPIK